MNDTLRELPDSTRVWVYGSSRPLRDDESSEIERELTAYVAGWAAHGAPLDAAAAVLENRFVVMAVDERAARASGCSIDDMVRRIGEIERVHDVSLLDGTLVYYRTPEGEIAACDRPTFRRRAAEGEITPRTIAFDPTIATLGELRAGAFERAVAETWHGRLLATEPQGTS
jgi:hypothetical protein